MKLAPLILLTSAFVAAQPCVAAARAQEGALRKTARVVSPEAPSATRAGQDETSEEKAEKTAAEAEPPVRLYLVGGRRLDVEEATETADGVWFRRGGVTTLLDRSRVERVERGPLPAPADATGGGDDAAGSWDTAADLPRVEKFFAEAFRRPLPVTALGQSDLHRRWGFDHQHAVDVGLHPDGPEGRALIAFLRQERIPHLVFRGPVPGVATGPHIHIGRPSRRTRH
jgi:hypothetical protein